MDLKYQILYFSDATSNNPNFDNEKLHCTPTDSIIHNFLEA